MTTAKTYFATAWIGSPLLGHSRRHAFNPNTMITSTSSFTRSLNPRRPRPVKRSFHPWHACTEQSPHSSTTPSSTTESSPTCSPTSPSSVPTPPPPSPFPEKDPRGLYGLLPFYVALFGAQLIPFTGLKSFSGDISYFAITAVCCIFIGVRRAPIEPPITTTALSGKQAIAAPFTASVFLFGSYLLLKYTKLDVSLILNVLTTVGGTLCVKEATEPLFHSLLSFLRLNDSTLFEGKPAPDGDPLKEEPSFNVSNALAVGTAVATSVAYWLKIPPAFVVSNAIAVSLASRVLSIIRPTTFLVAASLLTGLFFYDIFWVFGSEVMVSVATQIDLPAKLLFPRDAASIAESVVKYPYAILGVGDIVIPGFFISTAQSMDQQLAADVPEGRRPYFAAAMGAYTAALLACFGVNFVTNAAQPALLYLVPALVLSSLGVAVSRGELSKVLAFSVEEEKDKSEDVEGDGIAST